MDRLNADPPSTLNTGSVKQKSNNFSFSQKRRISIRRHSMPDIYIQFDDMYIFRCEQRSLRQNGRPSWRMWYWKHRIRCLFVNILCSDSDVPWYQYRIQPKRAYSSSSSRRCLCDILLQGLHPSPPYILVYACIAKCHLSVPLSIFRIGLRDVMWNETGACDGGARALMS